MRYWNDDSSPSCNALTCRICIVGRFELDWITWAGLYHSNPEIRVQLISFTVDSDRAVSVRYSVERNSAEATSICTVIARDFYKDIVGQIDVEIPAGQEKVELVSVVPTRNLAVNADVSTCRVK